MKVNKNYLIHYKACADDTMIFKMQNMVIMDISKMSSTPYENSGNDHSGHTLT